MKVEFRCSRCGHHLTLNVLDPQRQSPPTCGRRPGKRGVVMERVEGEQLFVAPARLLETSGPSGASTPPARGPAPTEEAPNMVHATRSATRRKASIA